jgi:hypothetical protein
MTADADLKRLVRIAVRRRDVLQHRLEHRLDVLARLFQLPARGARAAGGVEHREVQRLVIRAQLDEQVEDLIQHFVGPRVLAGRSC